MILDNKLVLIADDTPTNVGVILGVLRGSFRTKVATNGDLSYREDRRADEENGFEARSHIHKPSEQPTVPLSVAGK